MYQYICRNYDTYSNDTPINGFHPCSGFLEGVQNTGSITSLKKIGFLDIMF